MPARSTIRIAAVDGPDQEHLKAVRIFDWDRSFDLVGSDHRKVGVLLKKLGLARYPDRWVDISERPDIKEGDSFPFYPRQEPEPAPAPHEGA